MVHASVATVGIVVPSFADGGGVPAVARFLVRVASESARFVPRIISLATGAFDRENVRLASPGSWFRGVESNLREWEGLRFVHVGAPIGEFEFQRYRRRKALDEALNGCDVIQVVCGSPAWGNAVCGMSVPISLAAATRAKVERRRRDAHTGGLLASWRRGMTAVTDRLDDRALRCVDAIQVMNPWMLDYAKRQNAGRDVDICYIPPGIDDRRFHPLTLRDPEDDPYILCVGRFSDPRKNVDMLANAYARLSDRLKKRTRLILAGSSRPPQSFWSRVDALGVRERITYIENPSVSNLIELYQLASVFALPSDEEGFGVVLLESMACAVPVVSTRSGGPDGIVTDGRDGFLTPLDDAMTMAERLELLLSDPALNLAMGHQARHTIESRYAERVAGKAYLDVWDRLLVTVRKGS